MFNFFKRPIIINFTVEQVHPDSTIALIKTEEYISKEIAEAVVLAWKEHGFKQKAAVVGNIISIDFLTDEDLKRVGLMRIPNETTDIKAETPNYQDA